MIILSHPGDMRSSHCLRRKARQGSRPRAREITDASVVDALREHFGYRSAVDILFAAVGMRAERLNALLTAVATLATKDETR